MSKQELLIYKTCIDCRHCYIQWDGFCLHPKIAPDPADGGGRKIKWRDGDLPIPDWCPLEDIQILQED